MRSVSYPVRRPCHSMFVAVVFSLCIMAISSPMNSYAQPTLQVTPILTGIANPVAITHAGDGSGRLFIALQAGTIILYDGQQVLPAPFLDISALVTAGGEQGLLSVAFHPNYAANGFFTSTTLM